MSHRIEHGRWSENVDKWAGLPLQSVNAIANGGAHVETVEMLYFTESSVRIITEKIVYILHVLDSRYGSKGGLTRTSIRPWGTVHGKPRTWT
jgi:hypothetical protein